MTNWNIYEIFQEEEGFEIDLGFKAFDEEEIISFAKKNDPLPFHLDPAVAAESFFGELVCSGGQAFNFFYVARFVPLFGSTTVGGLGISNWDFLGPIVVNEKVFAKARCHRLRPSSSNPRLYIAVWVFEFRKSTHELLQKLEIKILHRRS